MTCYPASARERAMKIEQVILRALNKQITFWEAAHIARISPRHLRRLYERYRCLGFDGLYDRRKGQPSPKRVPWAVVEQVLSLLWFAKILVGFEINNIAAALLPVPRQDSKRG